MLFLFSPAAQATAFVPALERPRGAVAALDPRRGADLPRILEAVSAPLLGRPYLLGPLGEGEDDAHPLYRLDAFDCTTFLETVMANAYCFRSRAFDCLRDQLQRIRYGGAQVSFAERNHVPELDWLPHNVARGYLEDLSETRFPGEWKTAVPTIDRALWLAAHGVKGGPAAPVAKLRYLPAAFFFRKAEQKPEEAEALEAKLAAAKAEADAENDEKERERKRFRADLAYLRAAYVPIEERFAQLPSGTVLNLVRAAGKDKAKAKLTTLVSHQGLILRTAEGLRLRHAAANVGHVSEQSLADYLLRFVRSGNYRGIALYRILPAPARYQAHEKGPSASLEPAKANFDVP